MVRGATYNDSNFRLGGSSLTRPVKIISRGYKSKRGNNKKDFIITINYGNINIINGKGAKLC